MEQLRTGARRWFWAMKQAMVLAASVCLWPMAVLLAAMRIRFLIGGQVLRRIGHMALVPDLYFKTELLGWRSKYRDVLLAPKGAVVNPCLLSYWGRFMKIVSHPFLIALLRPFEKHPRLQHSLGSMPFPGRPQEKRLVKIVPAVYRIQAAYEAKHGGYPLLRLSDKDAVRGEQCLQQLGVPRGAWFVCLHVREMGYLPELSHHSHRNADIISYLPAVETIVERGGWVIRMGNSDMKRLPQMRQVIDYVHSGKHSDWMDVFCFARCRFFLGSASGPFVVAFAFGVPCVLANCIPLRDGAYSLRDLWIPKRYRSIREDRELTFAEVLRSRLDTIGLTEEYEAAGVAWIDNSPDEIKEVAVEMTDRLEGRLSYTAQDEQLQQRFKSLLEVDPLYCTTARVGRDFLRRHIRLLQEDSESLRKSVPHEKAGRGKTRLTLHANLRTGPHATP